MIRFGVWHGGDSYGFGDFRDSMELFETLSHAKRALQRRAECSRDHFTYMRSMNNDELFEPRSVQWFDTPATGGDQFIDLYHSYNTAKWVHGDGIYERLYLIDSGPYARLTLGPRGGVRMESF